MFLKNHIKGEKDPILLVKCSNIMNVVEYISIFTEGLFHHYFIF